MSDGRSSIIARGGQRAVDGRHILAVDTLHLPAARLEASADVFEERQVRRARERHPVGVVEHNQPAEPQRAGQRCRFARKTFHHVAVAGEHVGVVVHHLVRRPIECGREPALGDGHAEGIAKPLAERAGGDLHARGAAALGMTGRSASPLPELLQVVERQVVTGQVEEAVEQRARMTRRQHEPIAIGPRRVLRVVTKVAGPQHVGHRRRAHRHAGMPGLRFLHHVDRQHANRIDAELVQFVHARLRSIKVQAKLRLNHLSLELRLSLSFCPASRGGHLLWPGDKTCFNCHDSGHRRCLVSIQGDEDAAGHDRSRTDGRQHGAPAAARRAPLRGVRRARRRNDAARQRGRDRIALARRFRRPARAAARRVADAAGRGRRRHPGRARAAPAARRHHHRRREFVLRR